MGSILNYNFVVIHTFQEIQKDQTHIRLISARKANKIEKKQYLGESSAALLWGIMATFIITFDVLIWILAMSSLGSDFKDIWYIALTLSLIGGGLALFGAIVAKREWDM